MNIRKPTIVQQRDKTVYKVPVQYSSGEKELWYSVDKKYGSFISDSADVALIALLIPAMAHGENVHVESAISEELYYNLKGPYQVILQTVFPSLKRIKIFPEKLSSSRLPAGGVATGFSGGIDSFCVLADHYYSKDIPDNYRLTHLIFNNVGAHGAGGERLFSTRFSRVESIAKRIGLPIFGVNSNLDSFFIDLGFSFLETNTIRNISVAHLLRGGIGRFYYASSYHYKATAVGAPIGGMARFDPVALPLPATKSVDLISAGSEYTRVEKTLKVTAIKDSHNLLDICVQARKAEEIGMVNCSTCWKCLRTLLTLEIAGQLQNYERMFDLELYRKQRNGYIATILKSNDPLLQEILVFAKQKNFHLPISSELFAQTGIYKLFPYIDRAARVGDRFFKTGKKMLARKFIKT